MTLTLRSLMIDSVERFGDETAVRDAHHSLSYAQVRSRSDRVAHELVALGVSPGDPVAVMMSNQAAWAVADQAVIRAGGAKVPINDMLTAPEIEVILRDCGARVAIADAGLAPVARAAGVAEVILLDLDEPATGAPAGTEPGPPPVQVAEDDVALILYTGGTTGRPKGVMHTQAGLGVNLLAHVMEIGLGDDERMLLTAPLAHSAGFLLQAGLVKGAEVIVEKRFDPAAVLSRLHSDAVTFLFLVPTMIYRLLDAGDDGDPRPPSLRTILYGASPITAERLEQGIARFGPVFMQLYGQSEAPNFLTRLRREDHDPARPHLLASCGRPSAMVTVAVLDETGEQVPAGTAGEVCARAPYVMSGYHGLPQKTSATLAGEWLHTGDIGMLDPNGYLFLLDRKNDMVISGGMNVYTSEVEQCLASCPGIIRAAVVGIPHPDWGEAVVAFVVAGDDFDEAAVEARCRAALAAYKRPKAYRVVRDLPLTSVGKVDKKALRASWGGWERTA